MSTLYEIEHWRQHHEELLREARDRRLARQLRPARPGSALRLRDALLARARFLSPRKRRTAEC